MRIESVCVSIGYGDYLAQTLPENLALVDDFVVVTSADDEETRAVCRRHSVHHVLTDDHRRGGPFDKARCIARAMDQISAKDWVLQLDADIVLPRKFRRLVDVAHLDPETIYGADRCNLVGWDRWKNLKLHAGAWDNHAHECGHWWHPELQVCSRWVSSIHGFVPIGFFQMAHGSALVSNGYHQRNYRTTGHGDAARTDVQFALQWDRRHRQILPEVIVLHLEAEASALGANWKGRTTPRFGPPPVEKSCRPPHHHRPVS